MLRKLRRLGIGLVVFLLAGCAYDFRLPSSPRSTWHTAVVYQASILDSQLSAQAVAYQQATQQLLADIGWELQRFPALQQAHLSAARLALLAAGVVQPAIAAARWDGHTYRLTVYLTAEPERLVQALLRLHHQPQLVRELEAAYARMQRIRQRIDQLHATVSQDLSLRLKAQQQYATSIGALVATRLYLASIAAARLRRFQAAIASLTQAITLDPQYTAAYIKRGSLYDELGDYQKALQDLHTAIRLDKHAAPAYFSRGVTYARLGQHEQALADFTKAIALAPDHARAYYNRGTLYAEVGKYTQALADLTKAIALAPHHAELYANRGAVYAHLGKYRQALEDFGRALARDPNNALAYYNRAVSWRKLGKYAQAIADFETALRLGLRLAQAQLESTQQLTRVRRVQASLKKAGFDPGTPDGILGPRTRAALRQYQQQHGLPVTGELDSATLQALGITEAR